MAGCFRRRFAAVAPSGLRTPRGRGICYEPAIASSRARLGNAVTPVPEAIRSSQNQRVLSSLGSRPRWNISIESTTEDQYFQLCPPGEVVHSVGIPMSSSPSCNDRIVVNNQSFAPHARNSPGHRTGGGGIPITCECRPECPLRIEKAADHADAAEPSADTDAQRRVTDIRRTKILQLPNDRAPVVCHSAGK